MRPLLLLGILAALTGCSVNYQGTTFKAMPKFESSKEGEKHEEEKAEAAPTGGAVNARTASAFPITVPPSGKPSPKTAATPSADE